MSSEDEYEDYDEEDIEQSDDAGDVDAVEVDEGSDNEGAAEPDEADSEQFDTGAMISADNELKGAVDVKNQLSIWSSLLEWRITLQKALVAANRLPQPDHFHVVAFNSEVEAAAKQARKAVSRALENLLDMEQAIIDRNDQIEGGGKTHKPDASDDEAAIDDDEEIASDDELGDERDDGDDDEEKDQSEAESESEEDRSANEPPKAKRLRLSDVADIEQHLEDRATRIKSFRDNILDQWYYKTRYTGGKGSMDAFELPPVKVIEQIVSNKERLIKRTQLKRSNYEILCKSGDGGGEGSGDGEANEHDTEIFDDDDFYHQLLREVIEDKTSPESTNPVELSRKWIEIQRMRSKMKRKVDTRASKGRKIKLEQVMKPLVAFMAKQPNEQMTGEEIDELFASLFGCGRSE